MEFVHKVNCLDSDLETPVGVYLRKVGRRPGILLESAKGGRFSLIACNFVLSATCAQGALQLQTEDESLRPLRQLQGAPFAEALEQLLASLNISSELPPITRALYGYLGYGIAGLLEPKLSAHIPAWEAEASLVLPGTIYLFDHTYNRVYHITLCTQQAQVAPIKRLRAVARPAACPGRLREQANFMAAARQVKHMLQQGEAIQVVLSVPFAEPFAGRPFSIYRALRRLNPSPYMFYMHLSDGVVLGSSPEVLISCEADTLRLCPIAGTRPRGEDAVEDMRLADELLQDPKEQAEHVMLVDLGRNDLGRIAAAGTVEVERYMEVEKFSHVMHLSSCISAELGTGFGAMDVLRAVFPAGTVSGAPKIRAMEIIAALEQSPRGPYAGGIGWLGLDKQALYLDMGILIRSMWIRGQTVYWQAGAGLVHDSCAEKEWHECLNKARVLKEAIL